MNKKHIESIICWTVLLIPLSFMVYLYTIELGEIAYFSAFFVLLWPSFFILMAQYKYLRESKETPKPPFITLRNIRDNRGSFQVFVFEQAFLLIVWGMVFALLFGSFNLVISATLILVSIGLFVCYLLFAKHKDQERFILDIQKGVFKSDTRSLSFSARNIVYLDFPHQKNQLSAQTWKLQLQGEALYLIQETFHKSFHRWKFKARNKIQSAPPSRAEELAPILGLLMLLGLFLAPEIIHWIYKLF
jgi:hypothetical protein